MIFSVTTELWSTYHVCFIKVFKPALPPLLQQVQVVPSLLFLLSLHTADLCRTLTPVKNYVLIGHVIKTIPNTSFERCTYYCELDAKCISINFFAKTRDCEFNYASKEMFLHDLKRKEDSIYVHNIRKDSREIDPCKWLNCRNGASCQPLPQPSCTCLTGFKGPTCQSK